MVGKVIDLLFGCRHRLVTRPITPVRRCGNPPGDTYVSCLECGRQFHYDTRDMRVGTPMPTPRPSQYRDLNSFQSQH
jgi:hypothetical protein